MPVMRAGKISGPENLRMEYQADDGHGIHMPSNSWMPLIASLGFVPLGLGLSLMQAGVPFMGYTAIFGLIVIGSAIALWAIEGPTAITHPQENGLNLNIRTDFYNEHSWQRLRSRYSP